MIINQSLDNYQSAKGESVLYKSQRELDTWEHGALDISSAEVY